MKIPKKPAYFVSDKVIDGLVCMHSIPALYYDTERNKWEVDSERSIALFADKKRAEDYCAELNRRPWWLQVRISGAIKLVTTGDKVFTEDPHRRKRELRGTVIKLQGVCCRSAYYVGVGKNRGNSVKHRWEEMYKVGRFDLVRV